MGFDFQVAGVEGADAEVEIVKSPAAFLRTKADGGDLLMAGRVEVEPFF